MPRGTVWLQLVFEVILSIKKSDSPNCDNMDFQGKEAARASWNPREETAVTRGGGARMEKHDSGGLGDRSSTSLSAYYVLAQCWAPGPVPASRKQETEVLGTAGRGLGSKEGFLEEGVPKPRLER